MQVVIGSGHRDAKQGRPTARQPPRRRRAVAVATAAAVTDTDGMGAAPTHARHAQRGEGRHTGWRPLWGRASSRRDDGDTRAAGRGAGLAATRADAEINSTGLAAAPPSAADTAPHTSLGVPGTELYCSTPRACLGRAASSRRETRSVFQASTW